VRLIDDVNYTTQGLLAMDRWLSAVEKDSSAKPLSRKIIDDRPTDIHDQCTDGLGQVIPNQAICQLINPVFSTPRVVAGESIATDNQKCQLKPLRRTDFLPTVQFTDEEWSALVGAFPTGSATGASRAWTSGRRSPGGRTRTRAGRSSTEARRSGRRPPGRAAAGRPRRSRRGYGRSGRAAGSVDGGRIRSR